MKLKHKPRRGRKENLKPWQPGQSGNPGGRPRKKPITEALIELLAEIPPGKKKENARLLAEKLLSMARGGSVAAAHEILNRIEGKVTTILGGPDGAGIPLDVNMDKAALERRIVEVLETAKSRATAHASEREFAGRLKSALGR
jgi:Family of unknown function (DUF5681)